MSNAPRGLHEIVLGQFLIPRLWIISRRIFPREFFRPCFSRVSGPPPPKQKFMPEIHLQNCQHSSPIACAFLSPTFCHADFCFRGRPVRLSLPCGLSGPVLRDTARLSQRYPPIARYGVFGVSTWQIGCDTPPLF